MSATSKLLIKAFLCFSILTAIGCRDEQSKTPSTSGQTQAHLDGGNGGGTDVGSGGNGGEAEWKSITEELAEKLRLLNRAPIEQELFLKIKKNFPELAKKASVSFRNYPLIYGAETATEDNPSKVPVYKSASCEDLKTTTSDQERDAINFSSNMLIKVNGPKFYCYPKNKNEVRRLIFHEYLGLMGISEKTDGNTGYEITNALLKAFAALPKFDEARDVALIHTCQELQDIGSTDINMVVSGYMTPVKIWRLANDIDCSESDTFNNGEGFRPLIVWGHVDGDGYAIKNLKITNRVPLDKQLEFKEKEIDDLDAIEYEVNKSKSLFYVTCKACKISNLSLINADIEGGGLLVTHNQGSISNVSVQGRLHGALRLMGGLVSENYGSISQATVNVDIDQTPFPEEEKWNQWAGGISAEATNGSFLDCTVVARIKGVEFVGGLSAQMRNSIASNINMSVQLKADEYWSLSGLVASFDQSTLRNIRAKVQIQPGEHTKHHLRSFLVGAVGTVNAWVDAKKDLTAQQAEISYLNIDAKICGAEKETLDNKDLDTDDDHTRELRVAKDFGSLEEIKLTDNQIRTEFIKSCPSTRNN